MHAPRGDSGPSDEQPPFFLRFAHACRLLGCLDPSCALCANNPLKRCREDFCQSYTENEALCAKCGSQLLVELACRATLETVSLPDVLVQVSVVAGPPLSSVLGGGYGATGASSSTSSALPPPGEEQELLKSDPKPDSDDPIAREMGVWLLEADPNAANSDGHGRVLLSLQDDGSCRLPDLRITDRSDTFRSGGRAFASFRLLARAVMLDGPFDGGGAALALQHVEPCISPPFTVKSHRVRSDTREEPGQEFLHYKDSIQKLRFIGGVTADRLKSVQAHLPQIPYASITTVEELKQLMWYVDQHPHLLLDTKLQELLNMKGVHTKRWGYLRQQLLERVVYDDSACRAWFADASGTHGLLFKCVQGQVKMGAPMGLVERQSGRLMVHPAAAIRKDAERGGGEAEALMRGWQKAAERAWRLQGHPGWTIVADPLEVSASPFGAYAGGHVGGAPSAPGMGYLPADPGPGVAMETEAGEAYAATPMSDLVEFAAGEGYQGGPSSQPPLHEALSSTSALSPTASFSSFQANSLPLPHLPLDPTAGAGPGVAGTSHPGSFTGAAPPLPPLPFQQPYQVQRSASSTGGGGRYPMLGPRGSGVQKASSRGGSGAAGSGSGGQAAAFLSSSLDEASYRAAIRGARGGDVSAAAGPSGGYAAGQVGAAAWQGRAGYGGQGGSARSFDRQSAPSTFQQQQQQQQPGVSPTAEPEPNPFSLISEQQRTLQSAQPFLPFMPLPIAPSSAFPVQQQQQPWGGSAGAGAAPGGSPAFAAIPDSPFIPSLTPPAAGAAAGAGTAAAPPFLLLPGRPSGPTITTGASVSYSHEDPPASTGLGLGLPARPSFPLTLVTPTPHNPQRATQTPLTALGAAAAAADAPAWDRMEPAGSGPPFATGHSSHHQQHQQQLSQQQQRQHQHYHQHQQQQQQQSQQQAAFFSAAMPPDFATPHSFPFATPLASHVAAADSLQEWQAPEVPAWHLHASRAVHSAGNLGLTLAAPPPWRADDAQWAGDSGMQVEEQEQQGQGQEQEGPSRWAAEQEAAGTSAGGSGYGTGDPHRASAGSGQRQPAHAPQQPLPAGEAGMAVGHPAPAAAPLACAVHAPMATPPPHGGPSHGTMAAHPPPHQGPSHDSTAVAHHQGAHHRRQGSLHDPMVLEHRRGSSQDEIQAMLDSLERSPSAAMMLDLMLSEGQGQEQGAEGGGAFE